MTRCTARGETPENPDTASVPTERKLADGQHADHWVLCETERAKGYVRPLRLSYQHVGIPAPRFELRALRDDEQHHKDFGYVKFETYPESMAPLTGRFWTQADLDKIGKGCGVVTKMPQACAETYARKPDYYGSTFCCGCNGYRAVGEHGEFVWDGTDERVGT